MKSHSYPLAYPIHKYVPGPHIFIHLNNNDYTYHYEVFLKDSLSPFSAYKLPPVISYHDYI